MAKHSLVIVESPAKAKTIGKYLGKEFEVKACMGHLRDLPKSTLGVDLEHDFEPVYKPIKGKEDIIADLKKSAKSAEMVYLATDPDREGEAISWHLKQLLNLPDEKTRRVTFNEITKNVVQESIREPRDIDQKLVDAQQARRILDRIVGYELSPLLWKKIRRGLSAGRVQSVATRMVDDRDREIEEFKPEEYWTLDANLFGDDAKKLPFAARYHGKDGKKAELKSAEDVDAVVHETEHAPFTVKTVKRTDKQRSPSPPFTTSTMQQEASRKLSMTPRRTMAIAQQLYEGVDIEGEGTVGLITYMRTDSLRISEEALASAKTFIRGRYGEHYAQTHRYKAKAGAQDAHEAIRPSNVNWTPEQLKKDLTGEQYTYYCCEHVNSKDETAKCDFMTWDVPVKDDCPVCGHTMFKKAGRGFKKPFCINPECSNFLPEEKRGYPRKKAADSAEGEEPAAAAEETAEKKPARRTAAAKKADTAKTAAKKSAAKKPAAAKTAAKKPAAKKETASKAAAKTTSTRKTAAKKTVASKAKKPAGKE